ncbi:MAG: sugar ABC transporter ATP-binding protein [Clostridia bacterium]
MTDGQGALLEMKGIVKAFPGVLALDHVNLTVRRGEVLALMGENGAGKSTLMKVLSGVYKRDAGDIFLNGAKVEIANPLASQLMGISIIYQELNLLGNMSIAENIFLGREPKTSARFVDKKRQCEEARVLLREVGLDIDPTVKVARLSTAQKQMIEVAKALSFNAQLIIMDEPTSSLTETETITLFQIIRKLKEKGVSVLFISHRMNEIFEISDRVAVMRDGLMVGSFDTAEITETELISAMVGRDVKNIFVKEDAPIGEVVLEVKHLSTKSLLRDINFQVRAGEIVGFAGLVGAGRSEVMRALFGIDRKTAGEIYVRGQKVSINSTVDALKCGMGLVPEDRKDQGLILSTTVQRNVTLAALDRVSSHGFLRKKSERDLTNRYVDALNIKTPSILQRVVNLSGGNQQKVVIAKWMANDPRILILDEPTRGIDVGAKKEIHTLMSELAKRGIAIIMISSELPEVLGMSDRIVVMHEGRVKGELTRAQASQEAIMRLVVL